MLLQLNGRPDGKKMTDPHIDITYSELEEKEAAEFLHEKIRTFNNEHSPGHLASREPGAVRPLFLLLKDEAGNLIGGLAASTYWGWLFVDHLFVPEELRGLDLGSKLMARAERIARERGCQHAYLTTFSFQARRFYEKLDFEVVGSLEDYPPGETYFWMKKEFLSIHPPDKDKKDNGPG